MEPDESARHAEPMGRRARKALATRNAMFAAGLNAFENRPLAVVSVLDITEAADVAKGVFYLHFRGKDEFLVALWEHVQSAFLDAIRERLADCRSRRARIEAAATHYHAMVSAAPRECRFWLRMSSYFGDEIGEPGRMNRLRHRYLQELTGLIAGVASEDVRKDDVGLAIVVDGTSWGLISQVIQLADDSFDEAEFVASVTAAIRAHERVR